MSLDLTKVAPQVGGMVAGLKADSARAQQRLQCALDVLHDKSGELGRLKKKIAASKTTWLVADLVDGLDLCCQASPIPAEFAVLATDGSHIDVDRHQSTRCYLINIGAVVLRYGAHPAAVLDNYPNLYAAAADLVITPPGGSGRAQPVEGGLLGIKRSVEECRRLAAMAGELPESGHNLALLDGSLILWGLEAYPDFVTEALLSRGFLRYLAEVKKLNNNRKLALASYISLPRGTDVINALRVALCPNDVVNSDQQCKSCTARECDAVDGVRDRDVFASLLGDGDRSALFISQSSVVQKYYGDHQVYFFYLKVADEIARVEVPRWVALDEDLLQLTHSLILDQCRRGHGYPVALSEAHEQAMVTAADKHNFWQLVEMALVEETMPSVGSAKSRSKRTRWV